jgi:DNA-binding CsgD family transcriptional regulator
MVKVLVMRVEEYTLKEIAEEMGISIRGVRNIRQRMKDRGMEVP